MKHLLSSVAAAALLAFPAVQAQEDAALHQRGRPQIEVAFVLDTTGSMSGLIAGAKEKIWSIASEMLKTEEQADIRFGLIGFRDRGDNYVTRTYDLTSDINGVYGHLLAFEADGGGDRPESVNQALNEAVTQFGWSSSPRALRLVFLVGDSPPQEYKDDVDYDRTCGLARERGIRVNTVLAGDAQDTGAIWRAIAHLCGGSYMEIPQDGGMQQMATPYDDQINELQQRINSTVAPYGGLEQQAYLRGQMEDAAAAPAAVASDMASVRLRAGKPNRVLTGGNDLVEDYEDGVVDLTRLSEDELPDELKNLSDEELQVRVETRVAERAALNEEMTGLVAERDAWIAEELARVTAESGVDGFDLEVSRTVRAQAAEAGIAYRD
jgi:Mg-chelatase subunit ChlD